MNFLWTSSHITNWSTNKLIKLVESNYFGNLPSFILIIFFSTRTSHASPTVIILIRNDNCGHHKNLSLQVGAFLSRVPCFLSFSFSTKGFNLAIQVPTEEIYTDGISSNYLWLFTSDHAVNVLIPNSAVSAMICTYWESISIMDFLPVLLRPFRLGLNLTRSSFTKHTSLRIPRIIKLWVLSGILLSFRIS